MNRMLSSCKSVSCFFMLVGFVVCGFSEGQGFAQGPQRKMFEEKGVDPDPNGNFDDRFNGGPNREMENNPGNEGGRRAERGSKPSTRRGKSKKKETEIALPESANQPVLKMDLVGGFRIASDDEFAPTPTLRIYSDGRVVTGQKSPKVVPVEGVISQDRVRELLSFAVDECQFFDLDTDAIQEAMDATGKKNLLMDAGTTEFKLRLPDYGVNMIEVYALPFSAQRFEEVKELSSLVALQAKCKRIAAEINLGPDEEVASVLQLANIGLENEVENAPAFTLEHLQYAEQFVDGKKNAVFKQVFDTRGKGKQVAIANYTMSATGVTDIVVRVDAK